MQITLDRIQTIVNDGFHSAFTSLCLWRGTLYLAYRQAQSHGPETPGRIVILQSKDEGWNWQPCTTRATGGDDRDPKLVAWGDKLLVVWATYYPRWQPHGVITNAQLDILSHVAVTTDGQAWSCPIQVYRPGYWVWWAHEDVYNPESIVAVAHHTGGVRDVQTLHVLGSEDGYRWGTANSPLLPVGALRQPARDVSEPALTPDRLQAIVRCYGGTILGWREKLGRLWHWHRCTDIGLHCPMLLELARGTYLVAARHMPLVRETTTQWAWQDEDAIRERSDENEIPREGPCVKLYRWPRVRNVTQLATSLTPLDIAIPSGGDCGYPGLVRLNGTTVLISYYSQHERPEKPYGDIRLPEPADIYLARLDIAS